MLFGVYRADIVLTSAPAKEGLHRQRTTDTMTTHKPVALKGDRILLQGDTSLDSCRLAT